jgi:hypothetical protein
MTITIDMNKAREIWKDHIRAARAEEFKLLDTQYTKADEDSDAAQKSAVVKRKKQLRDAPDDPAIAAATTVEELKKVWPFE